VNNSAVGNFLQDHAATGGLSHPFVINQIYGKPDFYSDAALVEYINLGTGPLNSFEFGPTYAPQIAMGYVPSKLFDDKSWPDIQSYVHERVVLNNFVPEQQIYIDHALLRPSSYGTVRLASNNINDQPLIDFRFFENPNDLERLVDGIEYTAELMLNSSLLIEKGVRWSDQIVKVPACNSLTFPSRDYWRCFVKQTSATHYHPTSTCRMGPGPEIAVVDSHLR
jgi:choline dehydrogenase-like flavoprotein